MTRLIADRYVLLDEGPRKGGSAYVYKATDAKAGGELVAVKIFQARTFSTRVLDEIFNRDLEGYGRVEHPNVVRLIDYGRDDGEGHAYIVLEWIDKDLVTVFEESPYEGWDSFAPTAISILSGLAAIHEQRLLHRDIKPENVLITVGGTPKITDFGISRVVDRLNPSMTLAGHHTPPYSPPEADNGLHSFTRDVFAFGVMAVTVLGERRPVDYEETLKQLKDLDIPPDVVTFLQRCVSRDPPERPQTAVEAHRELRTLQDRREEKWTEKIHVYLSFTNRARGVIQEALEIDDEEVWDAAISDLDEPTFERPKDRPEARVPGDESDLFMSGTSFSYRIRPDRNAHGVWAIIDARRLASWILQAQRSRGWKAPVALRRSPPTDLNSAVQAMERLALGVLEHERLQQRVETEEEQRRAFRTWQSLLDAKREIEESRGEVLRYSAFNVRGRRVYFQLGSPPPEEIIGQPRMVRIGRNRAIAGDVEDVIENRVVLFVQRGNPSDLRASGQLIYDAEASKIAIERQRQALDAIRFGRAVRRDLADLLLEPANSDRPAPVNVLSFEQSELDKSKQDAVMAALGSSDFTLVEGPPGTGKTTFIAELILQVIKHNPADRILLASQTHVALDNALERIHVLAPTRRLLRLGRSDRIGEEVDALRLENQMELWRDDVIASSRGFLLEYARRLGIDVGEVDIVSTANKLRALRSTLRDLRSHIGIQQAERRQVVEQLSEVSSIAPQVLQVAEVIEEALRVGAPDPLRDAAARYMEAGIELAGRLEGSLPLSERLIVLDQALAQQRKELKEREGEERISREELAKALALETDPLPSSEDLIAKAEEVGPLGHTELTQLQELHQEWAERVGHGSEFNGALMASADVVGATCVGLAGLRGGLDVEFDVCIIDEASKATATEVLVPMSRAKKWVLVGDHHQLPPFQEDALLNPGLLEKFSLTSDDVNHTLFDLLRERLPRENVFQLSEQYRMVPAIGTLISECFYGGKLTSAHRGPDSAISLALGGSVVWLSTTDNGDRFEKPVKTSRVNVLEANIVKRLLQNINLTARAANRTLSVAVLTGYSAQRDQLIRTLAQIRDTTEHITTLISTVDAFQGREADVAVFSLTRSNTKGELGFLQSRQRVNVALSRGRDGLVIIGDDAFIRSAGDRNNPLLAALRHIERAGGECVLRRAEL